MSTCCCALSRGNIFSEQNGALNVRSAARKQPLPAIVDVIVAECEVDAAMVNKDIKMLVSDLIAAGILAEINSDETGNLILEE